MRVKIIVRHLRIRRRPDQHVAHPNYVRRRPCADCVDGIDPGTELSLGVRHENDDIVLPRSDRPAIDCRFYLKGAGRLTAAGLIGADVCRRSEARHDGYGAPLGWPRDRRA